MQAAEIIEIKKFMQLLLGTNAFDSYEFVSAVIKTDMSYSIDGHINRNFYDANDWEALPYSENTFLPWGIAREKIFQLIKGKQSPLQFKIILKAHKDLADSLINQSNSSQNPNDITGMFLNILYQDNKLNVTGGISYSFFTLEKDLEIQFFQQIITLLKSYSIDFNCEI